MEGSERVEEGSVVEQLEKREVGKDEYHCTIPISAHCQDVPLTGYDIAARHHSAAPA